MLSTALNVLQHWCKVVVHLPAAAKLPPSSDVAAMPLHLLQKGQQLHQEVPTQNDDNDRPQVAPDCLEVS